MFTKGDAFATADFDANSSFFNFTPPVVYGSAANAYEEDDEMLLISCEKPGSDEEDDCIEWLVFNIIELVIGEGGTEKTLPGVVETEAGLTGGTELLGVVEVEGVVFAASPSAERYNKSTLLS